MWRGVTVIMGVNVGVSGNTVFAGDGESVGRLVAVVLGGAVVVEQPVKKMKRNVNKSFFIVICLLSSRKSILAYFRS